MGAILACSACVASGETQPLWRTNSQDWQRVLEVNLLGVVYGIQAFVPHLVTAGTGHVVNIASLAGLMPTPFGGIYCANKHAVVAISETLRGELEMMGLPIGVTVVCPGLIRTPLAEGLLSLAQADDDTAAEHLPAELPTGSRQQLQATLQSGITTLLEPQVAAERILAAVEADRLYALTHGDLGDGARHRAEGILAALKNQY